MSFQLNDKWSFSSSTLDAGFITWETNVKNLVQKEVNFTFDGLDLRKMFSDSTYFERLQDSVASLFNVQENNESYTVGLPTRIIVGTNYKANGMLDVGATYFSDWSVGNYRPAFMLNGTLNLKEKLFISANYTISNRSYNNLGLAVYMKFLGIQLFAATDNVIGSLFLGSAKNLHASFGLGFQIGSIKDKDKKKKKDKEEEDEKNPPKE